MNEAQPNPAGPPPGRRSAGPVLTSFVRRLTVGYWIELIDCDKAEDARVCNHRFSFLQ